MRITRLVLAALLLMAPATTSLAQELTRLYAPRPPAGSAYVRIVPPQPAGAVRFGDATAQVTPGEVATIYRVVKGGAPVTIALDGKAVQGTPTPAADSFSTIVIGANGSARLIADGTDARNDLKAQLRVYNLVPGCKGAVAVEKGPTVFDGLATDETRSRAINPIEARLVGRCGNTETPAFQLPPLKAGDHFSLFLLEGPSGPELKGQRDETEPYHGAPE
ncbi:alginate O-acetyltransferase AlgF [Xanthobacter sp. TB0139]|uniref:alginate O-acetyltransferase AlgF n=1 Tax=Xanthobacter sp. TB0139 TaxID=3459178 RepID=UPI0040395B26